MRPTGNRRRLPENLIMALPEPFQSLLQLSERMVALAETQSWEELASAESERGRLAAQMPATLPQLPPEEVQALRSAVERILACNQRIQEHVQPWMEQVSPLLAALVPKQR